MELTIAQPYFARPYSQFARAYDGAIGIRNFIGTRAAFERVVQRYGIRFGSAADVGCGTGVFAAYLSRCWGVPVFAVDRSPQMLAIAARNCAGANVCLLQQDIRSLRLPCAVDLITANFDTVNHILTTRELKLAFQHIADNLRPGGHFIFDFLTPCQPLRSGRIYSRHVGSGSYSAVQRIRWSPSNKTLSISVAVCPLGPSISATELHRERVYSPAEMARCLSDVGFVIRGVYDAVTLRRATVCPSRVLAVARKLSTRGIPL